MEYFIISGRALEARRARLPVPSSQPISKRKRAPRLAGSSSIKKILANEMEAVKRLARIINANFGPGDLWLQLKYDNERLPASLEDARREAERFLRKVRDAYRKETGKKLRYVLTSSDKNPRTGQPARLHHHLVMDRVAWEYITRFWPEDQIGYVLLDGRGDYTGIARYMVSNARSDSHKRKWSCSKGLEKPVYTEPVPVAEADGIEPPAGAAVKENEVLYDEESGLDTAYMRCVLKERPRIERGAVHIGRTRKQLRN